MSGASNGSHSLLTKASKSKAPPFLPRRLNYYSIVTQRNHYAQTQKIAAQILAARKKTGVKHKRLKPVGFSYSVCKAVSLWQPLLKIFADFCKNFYFAHKHKNLHSKVLDFSSESLIILKGSDKQVRTFFIFSFLLTNRNVFIKPF